MHAARDKAGRGDFRIAAAALFALLVGAAPLEGEEPSSLFAGKVAAVFESRCLSCHNDADRKGGLSLATEATAQSGGESGPAVVPGKPDESLLLDFVRGDAPEMPKDGRPLSAEEIAALEQWIAGGAAWPKDVRLADKSVAGLDWWSLRPLRRPELPPVSADDRNRARTPIDRFVLSRLREAGLEASPEADRRTLIRRLYFDLIGLPPLPEEVDAFVAADDPLAYERLVDRLLASPQYGERWARHWLDVVHYADTHGYDKDKLRPNAWPYRDYVIRAFNEDKPYGRFVREQLAGDVFYPHTLDGNTALGFIAAGPWDFVGHAEVPESKIDGQVARHLDRDDMVSTTMNVFVSMTVQCAQCHNHKFDPVRQDDYYSLQAVFAALDRADRQFETSPETAGRRQALQRQLADNKQRAASLEAELARRAGEELARLDRRIAAVKSSVDRRPRPEFGYHSGIEKRQDAVKWVQVDLGREVPVAAIEYVGCHDNFAGIGAGFGFPVRYRIELACDAAFERGVQTVLDRTQADAANPGVAPQRVEVDGAAARYVRVTATKLAPRQNDFIFALAELRVLTAKGQNAALGAKVTSLDSIEAPVRWRRQNLVDGYYYGVSEKNGGDVNKGKEGAGDNLADLLRQREELLAGVDAADIRAGLAAVAHSTNEIERELAVLPPRQVVYAGTVHTGSGNFRGTGADGGRPREIHVLRRGDVRQPGKLVGPGAVDVAAGLPARFELPEGHDESQRRAALAEWIVDRRNPLTWRSLANRLWQYHFGRPLVDSPNDFGRMGRQPSHPELLDWLAVELRDGDQRLKRLQRMIVTSSTYRQSSADVPPMARIDGDNRLLWRMNRRRLEAEEIRDTALAVSGRLDSSMYGPGFWCFELDKPEHSPHFEYGRHDVDDPKSHRRAIYRFIVRSAPDPLMETLDCADPSQRVARRNETLTPLHALAMLNNRLMVRMAEHFAQRLERQSGDPDKQIEAAYRLALSRAPTADERSLLVRYAREHGLANACRVILNLNELVYVD